MPRPDLGDEGRRWALYAAQGRARLFGLKLPIRHFTISGAGLAVAVSVSWVFILFVGAVGLGGMEISCQRWTASFAATSTLFILSTVFLKGHQMSATLAPGLVWIRASRALLMRAHIIMPGFSLGCSGKTLITV